MKRYAATNDLKLMNLQESKLKYATEHFEEISPSTLTLTIVLGTMAYLGFLKLPFPTSPATPSYYRPLTNYHSRSLLNLSVVKKVKYRVDIK